MNTAIPFPRSRRVFRWPERKFIPLFSLFALLAGCSKAPVAIEEPPAPVDVAKVVQKTMPVQTLAIGNVQAYATVSINAQVGGVLQKVCFQRGDEVKAGQLLFQIDPAPFQASLQQAQGNLERDHAQLVNAQQELARYTELTKKGAASQEQFDQYTSAANQFLSAIKADEAAVESARLQLSYCTIKAPIDGVTGDIGFDAGNLIKPNDATPMVTVRQIRPVYVTFSVPEQQLPAISAALTRGKVAVEILAQDQSHQLEEGTLTFIDNNVNQTTGTVMMKATAANQAEVLWPGQFVFANLTLAVEKDALVVPSAAVQVGQAGNFVYVLKSDQTAQVQPVTVERTVKGESVISKGLRAGETVITDGQLRIIPGAKVFVKS